MRQASLKITTLDRLKNALEQIELRVKGMEARLDYHHCNQCSFAAMDRREVQTFIVVGAGEMDDAFEPIYVEADNSSVVYLGREPDMKGPLKLVHRWQSDDKEIRHEVVELLNKFGFLVEWDLSDEKAIILHN